MNNPSQVKTQLKESADVSAVVQEYMDSLLVDLFPDVESESTEPQVKAEEATQIAEATQVKQVVSEPIAQPTPETLETKVKAKIEVAPEAIVPKVEAPTEQNVQTVVEPAISEQTLETPAITQPAVSATESIENRLKQKLAEEEAKAEQAKTTQIIEEPQAHLKPVVKPEELRYPQAPVWAQQAFDVLLFDVCGLKLAVPMESLGKIIKVDHETNHLIGRPSWFIGAYNENEQNLYVVDTAQYIMPEKGFDLARDGFEFIIQLQRSQWTLACKKVYSTVRLEPDQVKWRSQQGKRQWLSGTVIDHMCALIHVDSLIDLLQAEAS